MRLPQHGDQQNAESDGFVIAGGAEQPRQHVLQPVVDDGHQCRTKQSTLQMGRTADNDAMSRYSVPALKLNGVGFTLRCMWA